MGINVNRKLLILKGGNGGRAETRTPDLLRAKQVLQKPQACAALHRAILIVHPLNIRFEIV
jgi:hypothetical protein